jgi:hypothetical protein
MRACIALAGLALACMAAGARAEDGEGAGQAVRPEAFISSDADGNEAHKLSLGWDWWRTDREHWAGLEVQDVRFSGEDWSHREQRAYLRAAGVFGPAPVDEDSWRWQARAGSNGDDVLGSASFHTEGPRRRELFVERELLETEAGIRDGQVVTFAGAAIDRPFGERLSATALAGLQDFDDGNLRSHLRGNVVYALLPEQGLSLQVRGRYYRNSEPYAGDYYSPQWHGEALGVLALRRVAGGHAWRAVAGIGRQRSSGEDWKRARMFELGYESPRWRSSWLRVHAGYTDSPVVTSSGTGSYSYRYLMLESVIAF